MRGVWLVLGLTLGCGGSDAPEETGEVVEAADPMLPGPYTAGTTQTEITGSTGVPLTLQVWYPSEDPAGFPHKYDGLLEGEATLDAAPACGENRPVVMFSHGNAGIRYQTPGFTEYLATHGYIVVAPDHTYNTFLDGDDDEFLNVVVRRPGDLKDAFDWLDTESDWADCVDGAAGYATAGHSFGGYTAFAAAGGTVTGDDIGGSVDLSDDRVWAAIGLAPWDVGGALTTDTVGVPSLILTGTQDLLTPPAQVDRLWDGLASTPRYYGTFPDAGHYTFSPIACDIGIVVDSDGCGDDFIDVDAAVALSAGASVAFLNGARGADAGYDRIPLDAAEITWETVE